MTKRKRSKKHKAEHPQHPKETVQHTPAKMPSKLKLVRAAIGFLLAISGLLFALHPRYSVDRDETYDPRNPFENPLVITNNGYFPLELKYSITIPKFKDIFENSYSNIQMHGFTVESLNSDRKVPIDLSKVIKTNIPNFVVSAMDLKIDMNAQTKLFKFIKYPYVKKESIHFKLRRSFDGKYIWQPTG